MHLTIYGPPIPKLRHRNRGKFYYDPQERQKKFVQRLMTEYLKNSFQTEDKRKLKELSDLAQAQSFDVSFVFRLPIANSLSDSQKNAKLWGLEDCNVKPDLDNLEKFYCDCANKILFEDDRLITRVTKRKVYSQNPRTEIIIMPSQQIKIKTAEKNALLQFGPTKIKNLREDIDRLSAHLSLFSSLVVNSDEQSISDYLQCLSHVEREKWLVEMGKLLCYFAMTWASEFKKLESKIKPLKDEL